jgi:RNA polymerase sigma factor (sigma-70 family)
MIEDELRLWERFEDARNELTVFYLSLIDRPAKYIARIAGRDGWEDLRQDAAIGLMKAIGRYHRDRGVEFRVFAKR